MREIKFRAWDNNKMYYQVRCGGVFDGIPTAPTVWNGNNGWVNVTGQPYTKVMQYTGLKDKNGKEIYEGDILKTTFINVYKENGIEVHQGIVEFSPLRGYYLKENDDIAMIFEDKTEVIGNIYEK